MRIIFSKYPYNQEVAEIMPIWTLPIPKLTPTSLKQGWKQGAGDAISSRWLGRTLDFVGNPGNETRCRVILNRLGSEKMTSVISSPLWGTRGVSFWNPYFCCFRCFLVALEFLKNWTLKVLVNNRGKSWSVGRMSFPPPCWWWMEKSRPKTGGPSIRCQVNAAHSSSRSCRCLFRCSLLFLDGTIQSFSSWLSPGFKLVLTSQPESIPPREQRWRHPNSLPFSDASDHVQPRDMEPSGEGSWW